MLQDLQERVPDIVMNKQFFWIGKKKIPSFHLHAILAFFTMEITFIFSTARMENLHCNLEGYRERRSYFFDRLTFSWLSQSTKDAARRMANDQDRHFMPRDKWKLWRAIHAESCLLSRCRRYNSRHANITIPGHSFIAQPV